MAKITHLAPISPEYLNYWGYLKITRSPGEIKYEGIRFSIVTSGEFQQGSSGLMVGTVTGIDFYERGVLAIQYRDIRIDATVLEVQLGLVGFSGESVAAALTISNDTIIGSAAADAIFGGVGSDLISAGGGNDAIAVGILGGDTVDGGAGVDTVVFDGRSTSYFVVLNGRDVTVWDTVLNDRHSLVDVEKLSFSNKTIDISTKQHGGFSDLPASIYQFFILAFGAAPGVEYLQQCADAYRGGATVRQITNAFVGKKQFTDIYPSSLSSKQLATSLISNVVKNSASAESKAQAINDIVSALEGGLTVGDMIFTVFTNLAAKPMSGDEWSNTALLFSKQIAVSKYYTETLNQAATDLTTLTSAISAVSEASAVSSADEIVSLIGLGLTRFGG